MFIDGFLVKGFRFVNIVPRSKFVTNEIPKKMQPIWWWPKMNNSKPPLFGKSKFQIKNGSVKVSFLKPITP